MRRIKVMLVVGMAAASASVAAPAMASAMTFTPPPGCTGSWNTMQSATFNHAPGTAPGCSVAEAHAA